MVFSSITINPKKSFLIAVILATLPVLAVFVFLYQAHGQPLPDKPNANAIVGISLAAASSTKDEAASSTKEKAVFEIHVANNGIILLRDARVISIIDSEIRVAMAWDSASFTWRVQVSPYNGTLLLNSKGEKVEITEIQVGDLVTVTGKLVSSGLEPLIKAQFVRL